MPRHSRIIEEVATIYCTKNDFTFNTVTWNVDRILLEFWNGLLVCIRVAFYKTLVSIKQSPRERKDILMKFDMLSRFYSKLASWVD